MSNQIKMSDAERRIRAASYFLDQTREFLSIDLEKSTWYLQASIIFTMSAKELLAGKGRIDSDQLEFLRRERNYTLHAGQMEKTYDGSKMYFPKRQNEDAVTTCAKAIKYLRTLLYEKGEKKDQNRIDAKMKRVGLLMMEGGKNWRHTDGKKTEGQAVSTFGMVKKETKPAVPETLYEWLYENADSRNLTEIQDALPIPLVKRYFGRRGGRLTGEDKIKIQEELDELTKMDIGRLLGRKGYKIENGRYWKIQ